MSGQLIWLCLIAMLLTAATLIESIRDYRAILRRKSDGKLRDMAIHSIAVEVVRIVKVTLLGIGVYLTIKGWIDYDTMLQRNWIMAIVSWMIGCTSLFDLVFRHRMMAKLKKEHYAKGK